MEYNFSTDELKSSYHKKVIDFLRKEFPLFDIIQEFSIKIDNRTLFCDIACKSPIKFIIEINPDHHYKFTPFFHGSIENFKRIQENDKLKEKWAEINNYLFIILKENDLKKDKFKKILKEYLG